MNWTGTCVTSILSMNCKIFLKNKINIHLIFFSRCSFVKIFQEIWTVDSPGNCCVFGGLPECEEERQTKECILGTSSSSRRNSGEVLLKSTYITNVKRANFSLLLSNCLWDFERAQKMAKICFQNSAPFSSSSLSYMEDPHYVSHWAGCFIYMISNPLGNIKPHCTDKKNSVPGYMTGHRVLNTVTKNGGKKG